MQATETREEREQAIAAEWDSLGGYVGDSSEPAPNDARVRLVIEWDDSGDPTDFDCCNYGNVSDPDFDNEYHQRGCTGLCKHQQAEQDRANRDGMTGIVGQYLTNGKWIHADSVWGFIGDDWKDSGYDLDIMSETINQFRHFDGC